jgi:hypothetical protein
VATLGAKIWGEGEHYGIYKYFEAQVRAAGGDSDIRHTNSANFCKSVNLRFQRLAASAYSRETGENEGGDVYWRWKYRLREGL